MKFLFTLALTLIAFCQCARAQAGPADLISNYRTAHSQGPVTSDATLNGIAQAQASAMASRDTLDHSVLGSFGSRIAAAGSERAAENIAYGYADFPRTLNQWINSSGHRTNLLMPGASRVGVASARSPTGQTYWAMVITGGSDNVTKKKRKVRN